MKDLPIASVLIVGLILAIAANFFIFSESFTAPVTSKAGHHNSIAGNAKYI